MATTSTSGLSSAGIGSGLDVNSIVTQLMSLERVPLTQLQKAASKIQTSISAVGQLKSMLSNVSDAASKLATASDWASLAATSSDAASVGVTVTSTSALATNHTVQVQQLATAQAAASTALNASAGVGEGSLTIELGSWNPAADNFTPASGSSAVTINIGSSDNTPAAIAAKVNAANAGIRASTITDSSGTRLVFTSTSTGAAAGFRVSADDTTGAPDGGLARLAWTGTGAGATAQGMTRTATAADAQAVLDGVSVTSPTNQLSSALSGLQINLNKVTTSPVSVTVAADTAAQRKLVDSFVSTYNSLASSLSTAMAYNATTKTAGVLQGDATANAIQRNLRNTITSSRTGGAFARLADVGITQQRDGTLAVNSTTLTAALARGTDIAELFGARSADGSNDGIARRMEKLADTLTGVDGTLTLRGTALQSQSRRNTDNQDKLSDRLVSTESRLRAQYAALDTKMSSLTALNNYVSQQVSLWTNKSNN